MNQELLHKLFDYKDGRLFWKESPSRNVKAGDVAGHFGKRRYAQIRINGKYYLKHRLVYMYHHGNLPEAPLVIDHINRKVSDNRIENLRLSTRCQNMWNQGARKNNTSGHKNVTWHKAANKWAAQIRYLGKRKHLGVFDDVEDAAEFAELASKMLHGEFANNLRPMKVALKYPQ